MENQQLSRLVYNPHVLHLLYTKLRYLTRVVGRNYQRYADSGDTTQNLMDCVILNNLYAEVLTRDLEEMLTTMQKERFPINLTHCHYEFYLFRFTQVFRLPMEPLTELFGSRHYKCESQLLKVVGESELFKANVQIVLREYMENFYFQVASAEKTQRRVQLFFHVKHTMENEVDGEVLDKETTRVLIRYDDELVASLFYIHIIGELLCLHESKARQIHHQHSISDAFKFVERNLYKQVATAKTPNDGNDDGHSKTLLLLQKLMHSVCTTYREHIISCVKYHQKDVVTQDVQTASWFPGFNTTTTTTTTKKHDDHREVNYEYVLERPLSGAVTVALSTASMTTIKKVVGQSEFFGNTGGKRRYQCPITVPIEYLTFTENRLHYELFLYRLAFELRLRKDHRCVGNGPTNTCYLCVYFKRSDINTRLHKFLHICDEPVESPEYSDRLTFLNEELCNVVIDLSQPMVLYGYKVLVNVYCLFDYLPLGGATTTSPLTELIDPCKLVDDLSNTVKLTRLERKMAEVISLCRKKVGVKEDDDECGDATGMAREHGLAMDVELVRLIAAAINNQKTEILRYERATISMLLNPGSATMTTHVAHLLNRIYVAHVDVLCQVIADRRGSVKFNQL